MRQLFVVAIISLQLIGTRSQNLRPFCLPSNITDNSTNCFDQCKSVQCARALNVISTLVSCYDSTLKSVLTSSPGLSADQKQVINNSLTYDINNLRTISSGALSTMPTQSDVFFTNMISTAPSSLAGIIYTANDAKYFINVFQNGACSSEDKAFRDLITEFNLYVSDASKQHAGFLNYMILLAVLLFMY
ncbi:hypothetical protein Ciccas_010932 [Cichlidogyrus casuarinus]|uniref:Uncharacterized protein n=1 Tax=Cichlidogyrus casuarinus TaxID=1844966 RepID=A0ABD2PSS3_9PLAT